MTNSINACSPFSRLRTLRLVRVMRMRWMGTSTASSTPGFWAGLIAVAIVCMTEECSFSGHIQTLKERQAPGSMQGMAGGVLTLLYPRLSTEKVCK